MTQRIWKYTLTTTSDNTIEMPIGAKILSVQAQMGEICIWALEEDARATDLVSRRFRVFGTGHTYDCRGKCTDLPGCDGRLEVTQQLQMQYDPPVKPRSKRGQRKRIWGYR